MPIHTSISQKLLGLTTALAFSVALAVPLSASASSCVFTMDLHFGVSGTQVTCLQQALIGANYSIPAGATGYFGSQTRTAVAAWQAANNVSPAVGYFGPLSRAAFNLGGTTSSTDATTATFSATPTTGVVPLTVTFSGSGVTSGSTYLIDYADDTTSGPLTAVEARVGATHTYSSVGTYLASLEPYIACEWITPKCLIATKTLGIVTVTVTSSTPAPTPTSLPRR